MGKIVWPPGEESWVAIFYDDEQQQIFLSAPKILFVQV